MNPQLHEEFLALAALYHTGEITDEEWALLQIHMAYCADCKRNFEEYRYVVGDVIPAMAAAAAQSATPPEESTTSLADAEQQLFAKLESKPAPPAATSVIGRTLPWMALSGFAAACAVLLAVVSVLYLRSERRTHTSQEARGGGTNNLPPATQPSRPPEEPSRSNSSSVQDDEIVRLRQQIAALQRTVDRSGPGASQLKHTLQQEQAARASAMAESQTLANQLADVQAEIDELRQKLQTSETDASTRASRVVELESKVRVLNASLDETRAALNDKDRMLALDKDFLAHDRDIRDLIGARNLYIADIFDTTETGKTAKPFGRIFYTQDRSLVFYGFDLEHQSGVKRAAAFQAWGSGADRQPVSLGLFYQDDAHQRWVLRCSDAKTLARLNMVYVTVEPPGGSRKPTGPQFLRAYLQIQPNHP